MHKTFIDHCFSLLNVSSSPGVCCVTTVLSYEITNAMHWLDCHVTCYLYRYFKILFSHLELIDIKPLIKLHSSYLNSSFLIILRALHFKRSCISLGYDDYARFFRQATSLNDFSTTVYEQCSTWTRYFMSRNGKGSLKTKVIGKNDFELLTPSPTPPIPH